MTCIAVMVATTPGSKKAKASSTRQAASLIAALGALLQYQTSSTILTTKHTSSTVPMQSSFIYGIFGFFECITDKNAFSKRKTVSFYYNRHFLIF